VYPVFLGLGRAWQGPGAWHKGSHVHMPGPMETGQVVNYSRFGARLV
jgi:hypothetical protein